MRSIMGQSQSRTHSHPLPMAAPPPTAPSSSNPSKTQECHICLEDLRTDLVACPCGHVYHGDCISQSLQVNSQCPSCRGPITARQLVRLFLEVPDTSANKTVETAADLVNQDPQIAALNERVALLVERLQWQKKQQDLLIQETKRGRHQTEQLLVDKQTLLQRVGALEANKNELLSKVAKYQIELSRQAEAARQMAVNKSISDYLNTSNDDVLEEEIQNPRELVMALKKACNFRHDQYLKAVHEKTKLKSMVQALQQQLESSRANNASSGGSGMPSHAHSHQDRGIKNKTGKSSMDGKRIFSASDFATPHPLDLKKRRVSISPGGMAPSSSSSASASASASSGLSASFTPRLETSHFRSSAYTDVARPGVSSTSSSATGTARSSHNVGFARSSHNPSQYGMYNLVPSRAPPVQASDHAVCRRGYDETGKLTNYFIPKEPKRSSQQTSRSTAFYSRRAAAPSSSSTASHSSARQLAGDRPEYALTAWLHKD